MPGWLVQVCMLTEADRLPLQAALKALVKDVDSGGHIASQLCETVFGI